MARWGRVVPSRKLGHYPPLTQVNRSLSRSLTDRPRCWSARLEARMAQFPELTVCVLLTRLSMARLSRTRQVCRRAGRNPRLSRLPGFGHPWGSCACWAPRVLAGSARNQAWSIAVMMVMRTLRVIAIVAGCLLPAGCSPGPVVSATVNGTPGHGSARPATGTASASSAAARSATRVTSCGRRRAGLAPWSYPVRVAGRRAGAYRAADRVRRTGRRRRGDGCVFPGPAGAAGGDQRRGTALGHQRRKASAAPQSTALEQVAAVDGARTWVVTDTGKLLVTGNAGASWSAQPLPTPVVAAASAGGWLWALSCPPVTSNSCRPNIERMKLPAGTWTATHPGLPVSGLEPQLDVLSATAAVIVLQGTHLALASTADGGTRWTVRAAPPGPQNMCRGDGGSGLFTAAGRATGGCCAPAAQPGEAAPRHLCAR